MITEMANSEVKAAIWQKNGSNQEISNTKLEKEEEAGVINGMVNTET